MATTYVHALLVAYVGRYLVPGALCGGASVQNDTRFFSGLVSLHEPYMLEEACTSFHPTTLKPNELSCKTWFDLDWQVCMVVNSDPH